MNVYLHVFYHGTNLRANQIEESIRIGLNEGSFLNFDALIASLLLQLMGVNFIPDISSQSKALDFLSFVY